MQSSLIKLHLVVPCVCRCQSTCSLVRLVRAPNDLTCHRLCCTLAVQKFIEEGKRLADEDGKTAAHAFRQRDRVGLDPPVDDFVAAAILVSRGLCLLSAHPSPSRCVGSWVFLLRLGAGDGISPQRTSRFPEQTKKASAKNSRTQKASSQTSSNTQAGADIGRFQRLHQRCALRCPFSGGTLA